jgi:hypothetical protein
MKTAAPRIMNMTMPNVGNQRRSLASVRCIGKLDSPLTYTPELS